MRRTIALVGTLGLAVTTAGWNAAMAAEGGVCGGSTTVDQLYAGAQKEGTVVWHVGFSEDQALELQKKFEEKYPGVHVEAISIETEEAPARMIAESQANNLTIDVGTGRTDTIEPLIERDMIETVDWQSFDGSIKKEAILFDGRLLRMYDFVNGWVYNTELLPKEDIPKSWEALLDPKYKGKIGTDANGELGLAALLSRGKWTEDDVKKWVVEFMKQNPILSSRGTVTLAQVGSGEYAIGGAPIQVVPQMQKDGAPIAILPVGPLSALATSMFVPKGAPHPNAACLLAVWLASADGTAVWQSLGRGLATPCEASKFSQQVCEAGIDIEIVDDFAEAKFEATTAAIALDEYVGMGLKPADK